MPDAKKTMLSGVHATEEQLIAPRYLMQISAHIKFPYTKLVLLASENLLSPYTGCITE